MFRRIATVLVVLAFVLTAYFLIPSKKALAGSFNAPVILVHGFNVNSKIDCNTGSTFGDIQTFFTNQGYWNTRTVGFYNNDYDCDTSIQLESSHCTGWYDSGSNDGTVNEDIRHVSCLLAWWIWDHYTSQGITVAVVAHSMGGILIRQAMNDTPYEIQFPPYLMISDVATAGSPHQGLTAGAAWGLGIKDGCPGNCTQVAQMEAYNALMSNMNSTSFRGGFARNPQGNGGTDWTTMSSENDEVLQWCVAGESLGAPSGVDATELCGLMPGATHFVIYPGPSPSLQSWWISHRFPK